MAQRIATRTLQTRLYSAAAAPKAAAKPVPAAQVLVQKASNGVNVATQESHSSLARVVIAVKAGSRYEEPHQRGVSHCLRVISDLTQREIRAFRLTRECHQMAANISCTTSRENIIYSLEVPKNNLQSALPMLAGMAFSQSFRPWEINDTLPRLEYELLSVGEQPEKCVVENMHAAAYRDSTLGRSIYSPYFQISQFTPDLLLEYTGQQFVADNISMSGVGVDESVLLDVANALNLEPNKKSGAAAKYFGGEKRENTEHLHAYTMLVGEGASLNSKELYTFAVLEQLLGGGGQIKWASNTTSNRVNAALANKTQHPFYVQSFNVNYTDSGLFGVSAVTVPENSELVIKTVAEQLRELADKPVDGAALQGAKNRVKSTVAFQHECPSDLVVSRAIDLLNNGKVTDLAACMSSIETVSSASVQTAARKMIAGKMTMATMGEIHTVPYLDQL